MVLPRRDRRRATRPESDSTIARPAGVVVGLEVRGGIRQVEVDGQRLASSDTMAMQTPGAEASRDRYEIEITGGISKLSLSAF